MSSNSASRWTVEDFDLVQMVCFDMNGIARGKLIPKEIARNVAAKKFFELFQYVQTVGHAADMPMRVPEIMQTGLDNGILVPILDTLVELSWVSRPGRRVGQVIGHMLQEDGQPEPTTIRYQVDRKLKKLEMMGYTMTSSFTCQFTAFKSGSDCQQFLGSDDPSATSPYSTLGTEEFMFDACDLLQRAGIDVDSWSRGKGRGAYEVTIAPSEGIKTVDMTARLKQGIPSIMKSNGYQATFMTRPHDADTALTFPFRFTIRTPYGENAFYDECKANKISDLGNHWIAGVIQHGAAITALCRPTVNCYRRNSSSSDKPDNFAQTPQKLDWTIDSAATFISVHVTGSDVWLETRIPSSACNPYLVMLAILAAGVDGIEKKLTCPKQLSPDAQLVPESLAAAIDALVEDEVLEEALSPLFTKAYAAIKRDAEIAKYKDIEDNDEKIRNLEKDLYLIRL